MPDLPRESSSCWCVDPEERELVSHVCCCAYGAFRVGMLREGTSQGRVEFAGCTAHRPILRRMAASIRRSASSMFSMLFAYEKRMKPSPKAPKAVPDRQATPPSYSK